MDKEDVVHKQIEYYSAQKRNEIMPLDTTWMDLEIITLNEVNQKEKDKYISLIHGLFKNDTNQLIYRRKTDLAL